MNTKSILLAIGFGLAALGIVEYNVVKERKLREKKLENERSYIDKLTPEQVAYLEQDKLAVRRAELELRNTEAELKKTVVTFKTQIQNEIETKTMKSIRDEMRTTFDTWSTKFENRMDNKVDNLITRIDNLSDKYGGVKPASNTAPAMPSISVVNAPNNQ